MKVAVSSLAPILRSDTQGRILARLMVDPSRRFSLSEIADREHSSMPTVLREVRRAEDAGIVTTEKVGPTRLVRANTDHPLYAALSQVVLATYGPPAIIAKEFQGVEGIVAVVLFGSWAARYLGQAGRAPNDIDVLVIGSPDRDAADDAAERSEQVIGLPVQVTVRSRQQWETSRDSFIEEVKHRPLVIVSTEDDVADDLQRIAHGRMATA